MENNVYPELKARKLHAYAASFSDDLARNLIAANTKEGDVCLDPFIGASTSLLQARLMRRSGVGIDIDPIACLISRVITTLYSQDEVAELFQSMEEHLRLTAPAFTKIAFTDSSFLPGTEFSICDRVVRVPDIQQIEFWFAPVQRAILATLTEIAAGYNARYKDIVDLAISSSIIHKWPNTISQARDIDHSRPHRMIRKNLTPDSQLRLFTQNFTRIAKLIKTLNDLTDGHCGQFEILSGDSCKLLSLSEPNKFDYVITSPPYFNAIDYPRAHKFAQWWLWEGSSIDRRSYVGLKSMQFTEDIINQSENIIPLHADVLRTIRDVSVPLLSSFCVYVQDMNDIVRGIARVLKTGKRLSFVLANNRAKGIHLPVADIVQEMLQRNGFESIQSEAKPIAANRRRYPYGIKGFSGLMEVEYIITATKNI
jgi:DNA modification methylase